MPAIVWVYPTDSSATAFNNTGTLNKTEGTSTSSWSLALSGSGPINIQNGTFNLGGSYPNSKLAGPISIASGTTLGYGAGGVLDGGKVTGAGTLNFNAATTVTGAYSFAGITQIQSGSGVAITFQNPTSITTLNLISGVLAGPGPVTIGTMDWTNGGIAGALVIPAKATLQLNTPSFGSCGSGSFYLAGGTINNSGTVTQTFAGSVGGSCNHGFEISQGGVINNLAGGVWNIDGDVWVYATDSSATAFNNAGTINKTAGTNTSIWTLPFNNTATANFNTGTTSLTASTNPNVNFPAGTLSGTINIAAAAALNFAQGGTLKNGQANGAGTFNLTTTNTNGTTSITGTYKATVPVQMLGGTLNVNAAATLNASNLTVTNATLTVAGTTSIGKLNVTATTGNSSGGTVNGPGTITVTDTLTWGAGSVNMTGTFNVQNMSLASNSSFGFMLGSNPLSVNAKLSLNGNFTATLTGSNPAVGTIFKVLNFANSYLGDFADFNLPIVGTNDYLKTNLTSSGLSFTVTPNKQPNPLAPSTW